MKIRFNVACQVCAFGNRCSHKRTYRYTKIGGNNFARIASVNRRKTGERARSSSKIPAVRARDTAERDYYAITAVISVAFRADIDLSSFPRSNGEVGCKRDNAGLAWADPVSLWFEGGEPARGKLKAAQQAENRRWGRDGSVADEKELVGGGEVGTGFERLGRGRGRKTVGKEKEGGKEGAGGRRGAVPERGRSVSEVNKREKRRRASEEGR
ncbi:hypothetical protein DBV15_05165 [Temnothorax longispinosus]|uniref:Uncharacterized protein n=1 Tax=Temnothorax longispinosus TaxID=300112 RepID=A0A4S2KTJ2_9HYME|nr:hypothetical protein DBV15_05165 [Temnothorax longispinosus]